MLKQVSVFLENKQGRLRDVLKILADAKVDIRSLSIAETSDYGVLRLIVDKTDKALETLKENNFRVNITNVIGVEIDDVSGSMFKFVDLLYGQNINVEYSYTYTPLNAGKCAFAVRVNDDKLEEAIKIIRSSKDIKLIE